MLNLISYCLSIIFLLFLMAAAIGNWLDKKEIPNVDKLDLILRNQFSLTKKIDTIMLTFTDFTTALDNVDKAIAALPTSTGVLTDDQANTVLTRIQGQATALQALAPAPVEPAA